MRRFEDRLEAGRRVAALLNDYEGHDDVLIVALPRGGVPVAFEVARLLHAPLDVFLVHRLRIPGHRELAVGSVASGGVLMVNEAVADALGVDSDAIDELAAREQRELEAREHFYREGRALHDLVGRIAILVDDGLSTGSTMRVAAEAVHRLGPARVVVAAPVGPASTCAQLRREVDEVYCAATPEPFRAVGLWYEDFSPVDDAEIQRLLHEAIPFGAGRRGAHPARPHVLD